MFNLTSHGFDLTSGKIISNYLKFQNFRLYKPPNIFDHLANLGSAYQANFHYKLNVHSAKFLLLQTELKKGLELLNIKFSENILDLMFKEADRQ